MTVRSKIVSTVKFKDLVIPTTFFVFTFTVGKRKIHHTENNIKRIIILYLIVGSIGSN